MGIIKISLRTNRTALEDSDLFQTMGVHNQENKYGSKYVMFCVCVHILIQNRIYILLT